MEKSNCCNKPIYVTGGEKLTNFYVCQGCQKACDTVSEGGWGTRVIVLINEYKRGSISQDLTIYNFNNLISSLISDTIRKTIEEVAKKIEDDIKSWEKHSAGNYKDGAVDALKTMKDNLKNI